jgi:hypothetical protein
VGAYHSGRVRPFFDPILGVVVVCEGGGPGPAHDAESVRGAKRL